MTCASCVDTIQRSLTDLQGIESANVNLATERATISYDPSKVDIEQIKKSVRDAGYDVVLNVVTISVGGMSCASCANTIEEALMSLDGVQAASVNLASDKVTITYDPAGRAHPRSEEGDPRFRLRGDRSRIGRY